MKRCNRRKTIESAVESRFAFGNGFLGMRAARSVSRGPTWVGWLGWASWPRCYVAGLFDVTNTEPPVPALVPVADWSRVRILQTENRCWGARAKCASASASSTSAEVSRARESRRGSALRRGNRRRARRCKYRCRLPTCGCGRTRQRSLTARTVPFAAVRRLDRANLPRGGTAR